MGREGSNRNLVAHIGLCWLLGLIPSLPYLFDHSLKDCSQHCEVCWIPYDNKFLAWWSATTGCILPAMMMITSLLVIRVHFFTFDVEDNIKVEHQQHRRIIHIMAALTLCFIICSMPITVVFISSTITKPEDSQWMGLAYIASVSNSVINPIIFMSSSLQFRKVFLDLVKVKKLSVTGGKTRKDTQEWSQGTVKSKDSGLGPSME